MAPERNECVSRKWRPLISLKEMHSNTHMNAVKIRLVMVA